ncbi:unnamed protein product [Brassicogethes aeneus]|uniref:Phospholipase A2-like domain-containing protein n=1 Tax=Brassicogethes aeneus TaxID=1431903 RepID=A0A9P0BII1_BRAAE|nr:unnamed protein product [Brassicogethes aeneus]
MSEMDDVDTYYENPFEDRAHWNVPFSKVPDQISEGSTINMAILPKYPHIGPGNPIYGSSENELDEIARQHDIAYKNAKSPLDILKADEIFLSDMKAYETEGIYDWIVNKISYGGIYIKHNFEKKYGVLYPIFSKNQIESIKLNNKELQLIREEQENNKLSKIEEFENISVSSLNRINMNKLYDNIKALWKSNVKSNFATFRIDEGVTNEYINQNMAHDESVRYEKNKEVYLEKFKNYYNSLEIYAKNLLMTYRSKGTISEDIWLDAKNKLENWDSLNGTSRFYYIDYNAKYNLDRALTTGIFNELSDMKQKQLNMYITNNKLYIDKQLENFHKINKRAFEDTTGMSKQSKAILSQQLRYHGISWEQHRSTPAYLFLKSPSFRHYIIHKFNLNDNITWFNGEEMSLKNYLNMHQLTKLYIERELRSSSNTMLKQWLTKDSSIPPEHPEDTEFDEISQFSQGTKRPNTETTQTGPTKVKVIEEPQQSTSSTPSGAKRPSTTPAIADISAKRPSSTNNEGSSTTVGPQVHQQDINPAGHTANTGGPTNTEAGIKKAQVSGSLSEFKVKMSGNYNSHKISKYTKSFVHFFTLKKKANAFKDVMKMTYKSVLLNLIVVDCNDKDIFDEEDTNSLFTVIHEFYCTLNTKLKTKNADITWIPLTLEDGNTILYCVIVTLPFNIKYKTYYLKFSTILQFCVMTYHMALLEIVENFDDDDLVQSGWMSCFVKYLNAGNFGISWDDELSREEEAQSYKRKSGNNSGGSNDAGPSNRDRDGLNSDILENNYKDKIWHVSKNNITEGVYNNTEDFLAVNKNYDAPSLSKKFNCKKALSFVINVDPISYGGVVKNKLFLLITLIRVLIHNILNNLETSQEYDILAIIEDSTIRGYHVHFTIFMNNVIPKNIRDQLFQLISGNTMTAGTQQTQLSFNNTIYSICPELYDQKTIRVAKVFEDEGSADDFYRSHDGTGFKSNNALVLPVNDIQYLIPYPTNSDATPWTNNADVLNTVSGTQGTAKNYTPDKNVGLQPLTIDDIKKIYYPDLLMDNKHVKLLYPGENLLEHHIECDDEINNIDCSAPQFAEPLYMMDSRVGVSNQLNIKNNPKLLLHNRVFNVIRGPLNYANYGIYDSILTRDANDQKNEILSKQLLGYKFNDMFSNAPPQFFIKELNLECVPMDPYIPRPLQYGFANVMAEHVVTGVGQSAIKIFMKNKLPEKLMSPDLWTNPSLRLRTPESLVAKTFVELNNALFDETTFDTLNEEELPQSRFTYSLHGSVPTNVFNNAS